MATKNVYLKIKTSTGYDLLYPATHVDQVEGLAAELLSVYSAISAKQDILISATNIKTINGANILGSGDIVLATANDYADSLAFNTGTGVLTIGRTGALPDLTVNIDGRYLLTTGKAADSEKLDGEDSSYFSSRTYVSSRGQNLLTNGSALLGNNQNFSSFTFDGAQTYYSGGSFKFIGQGTPWTDEFMPVNAELQYRISTFAKSQNAAGIYFMMVGCYDVDNLPIDATHHMYFANTLTTLAEDLLPGATSVLLTSTANWYNDGDGSNPYYRSFIFWNYTNSFGYTYPPLTYSRNWYQGVWNPGGINYTTNRITFATPWAGPAIAEGTQLSNGSAGGTYKYMGFVSQVIPTTWTSYYAVVNGVDLTGTNDSSKFSPGTAKVKIGWLMNYAGTGGADTIWLANLSFGLEYYSKINSNGHTFDWAAKSINAGPNYNDRIAFNMYDQFAWDTTNVSHFGMTNLAGNGLFLSGYYGLRMFTNGAQRLSILSNGDIGINSTSPTSRLEIAGGDFTEMLKFSYSYAPGTYYLKMRHMTTSGVVRQVFDQRNADTEYLSVLAFKQGNVGIGTSEPAEKLAVIGNLKLESTGDQSTYIMLNPYSAGIGTPYAWYLSAGSSGTSYDFRVQEAANTYLTIRNSVSGHGGKVGIGTTVPEAKLEVVGDVQQTFEAAGFYNNTAYGGGAVTDYKAEARINLGKIEGTSRQPMGAIGGAPTNNGDSANGYLSFYTRNAHAMTERIRIDKDGNVGIGTATPAHLLTVTASVYPEIALYSTYDFSENRNWKIRINNFGSGTWGGLAIMQGSTKWGAPDTARFGIDINGNVGIGNSAPSEKLEVTGNIHLTTGANRYVRIGSASNYYYTLKSDGDNFYILEGGGGVPRLSIKYNASAPISGFVGINTTNPLSRFSVVDFDNYALPVLGSGASNFSILKADVQDGSNAGAYGLLMGINGSTGNSWLQVQRVDATAQAYNLLLQPSGGNVGIGTSEPSEKLHVVGNAIISGMIKGNLYNTEGGVRKIINPKGGTFTNDTGDSQGALRIKLPATAWTSTMMRMIVDVYDYNHDTSFSVEIGGYLHGGPGWEHTFAIFNSTSAMDVTPQVTFALDASYYGVIYIGDISQNGAWDYAIISVREILAGYAGDGIAEWNDALSISYATSYGTDSVQATETGKRADADTLDGYTSAEFLLKTGGTMTGNTIYGNYGLGVVGTYAAAKFQNVFAMGNLYRMKSDGSSLVNDAGNDSFYGIGWTHSDNSDANAKKITGHHAIFVSAGVTKSAIGDHIWTGGNITGSDITAGSQIYLTAQGAGVYMKDESTATQWHVHMHGDRLRLFNGTTEQVLLSVGDTATSAYSAAIITASTTNNDWVQSFHDTPAHAKTFRENSVGGPSGTWWFTDNYRHSNSSGYWGTQIAWGWEDNALRMLQRNVTNNTFSTWVEYLNSGNFTNWAPSKTGTGASGSWAINITGSSANAPSIYYSDGPRDLSDRLPNWATRRVTFDFVAASVVGGTGNYGGVMTYIPWSGTTEGTGDSSYQLAFANRTGGNASGIPDLKIRNGIDTTWNAWHTLLHTGNFVAGTDYSAPHSHPYLSSTGTAVDSDKVDGKHIVVLTQAAYNALTPDASTIYFIVG